MMWMWSASFAQWYWVLLSLSIIVKSLSFCFWVLCRDVVVSDGTGLISMVWNFLRDLLVSPMYSAAQLCAGNFQWKIMPVFWASGMGPFGCMSKYLIVLVPLKKILTLYFARAHLYCSLRPLMYGMTTHIPSMNIPVDGFGFLLVFCWGLPC